MVFDDLLNRHHGKLVYLDFWAGWCVPCIKEMPNSEQLSKEFTDGVSFVYLSLDKNFDTWQNSSKKFLDHHPEENYYLDSMNIKRVTAEFNVVSIPRYMLFNQEGKLVLQDAPRPGSEEIRSIFTSLIEEDI